MGRLAILVLWCGFVIGACSSGDSVSCRPGTGNACTCIVSKPEANDNACNSSSFGPDTLCVRFINDGSCTCLGFTCAKDTNENAVVCGFDQPSSGQTPVPPTSCTGAHYCGRKTPIGGKDVLTECLCKDTACSGANEQERSSCTDEDTIQALRSAKASEFSVPVNQVSDCRVAAGGGGGGSGGGGSDAGGSNTDSGSGASCKSAGPGTCGDTPALNHCNCGAGCYRNSASAGSGFSCHITCTTDDDCANLYSFATTCKPFVADTGTSLKECTQ